MKKILRMALLILICIPASLYLQAQAPLAPDQNPAYSASRDKYISTSDSLTTWHGNTFQETYKSIDYMQMRQEARMARKAFRSELRLEDARNGWGYYNNGYYPYYQNIIFSAARYQYHNRAYGYRQRNSAYIRNILPWALTLGLFCR